LQEAFSRRKSHRKFKNKPLNLHELTFLLLAIQGVRNIVIKGERITRTVPSAGCRHPFETYLACTAINSGTCAIGAYYQEEIDALVGLDGEEEFVMYLAPVGKI
jgi:nitroreductase